MISIYINKNYTREKTVSHVVEASEVCVNFGRERKEERNFKKISNKNERYNNCKR
jgi:hypothetical protein